MSTSSIPSPEEAEAQIWSWGEVDKCFQMLHLLARTGEIQDPDLRGQIVTVFLHHLRACGSCWPNVLMAADNCPDPFKKRIYFNVYHLSQFELMKAYGGDAVVAQEAEGQRISIKYPSYMEEPWVGGEVYLPSNLVQEALIILDVREEALFKDPRPLLQRLDEVSASEVQDYDRPSGRGVQWWTIVGDRPTRLLIRWQGETRSVADDWTLLPRYKRLVAKHDPESREGPSGKAALRLRDLTLRYDGRSWFAGYLKKTLKYRAEDARRHDAKDAFGRSVVADLDCPRPVDDAGGRGWTLNRVFEETREQSQREEEKVLEALDLWALRKRLHLTKRQRRIFRLKAEGLSDEAVGARLGLRRETVNREIKEIKKKAARMKV